jgi:hypothetical protein
MEDIYRNSADAIFKRNIFKSLVTNKLPCCLFISLLKMVLKVMLLVSGRGLHCYRGWRWSPYYRPAPWLLHPWKIQVNSTE